MSLQLLQLTSEAVDTFPPLTSAAGGALYITEIVRKFKLSKKEWSEFGQHVQDVVACIIQALPDATESLADMESKIMALQSTLDEIKRDIDSIRNQKPSRRIRSFIKDQEKIAEMTKRLDNASLIFNLSAIMPIGLKPKNTLKSVNIQDIVNRVTAKYGDKMVLQINQTSDLLSLTYIDGASWNPEQVCLPGTCLTLLKDIYVWIDTIDSNRIFWLSGVAGSGKTTIANTVAQHFHGGPLVLSFLFSRSIFNRSTPRDLFTTFARDLATRSTAIAGDIGNSLKQDPTLASSSLLRQFETLLLGPSHRYPINEPVLIIIDAVDEALDADDNLGTQLLAILGNEAQKLPSNFRILVTSRPTSRIEIFLAGRGRSTDIYVSEELNKTIFPEITTYVTIQIQPVASVEWMGDEEATLAARQMATKTYVGYVDDSHSFVNESFPFQSFTFAMLRQGFPRASPLKFIEPHMCIPVFPNTNHPSRSPIQPDKPLPWPNCYHASFEKMTFRVRTAHMNSTSATRLPPSQVELHLEAIMDDEDRVEELKQAAPPLHDTELPIPAPEKQDIKCVLAEQEASPSISSRSISASIISAIDDDEALDEDERMANRPPLKMPLIQMSYDLSTVGEVADPQDLFAEVEAIKQLQNQARLRAPARKALAAEAIARAYEEAQKIDDAAFGRS